MAKEFAKAFYNSKRWKQCKQSFASERQMIDGGLCQVCHNRTGYIVHHRVALTADNISEPEVALAHENLMYVCKECHDMFEGHGVGRNGPRPLCIFDEDGNPISLRECDVSPLKLKLKSG